MIPISRIFKPTRLGLIAASALTFLFGSTAYQAAKAQDPIYTDVHNFNSYADGANNETQMIKSSDGILYGATWAGGTNGDGTIFALNAGVYTTLHSFTGNPDGVNPLGRLVIGSDGNLYGTTYNGGVNNDGTLFKIVIGTSIPHTYSYQKLFDFNGALGVNPEGALVQAADGNIYGTANSGGTNGYGDIWRFKPVTAPVVTLYYSFTNGSPNADGNDPRGDHHFLSFARNATNGRL